MCNKFSKVNNTQTTITISYIFLTFLCLFVQIKHAGCSSSLALFGENGPLTVNDDLSLNVNPYSWNSNATVVWVDQPVGTG